jgi:hypothetical protein
MFNICHWHTVSLQLRLGSVSEAACVLVDLPIAIFKTLTFQPITVCGSVQAAMRFAISTYGSTARQPRRAPRVRTGAGPRSRCYVAPAPLVPLEDERAVWGDGWASVQNRATRTVQYGLGADVPFQLVGGEHTRQLRLVNMLLFVFCGYDVRLLGL